MPQYLHPGVYVEEKPSDVKPIAGVGTSTCGFVGLMPPQITILEPNPKYVPDGAEKPYVARTFPPAEIKPDDLTKMKTEAADAKTALRSAQDALRAAQKPAAATGGSAGPSAGGGAGGDFPEKLKDFRDKETAAKTANEKYQRALTDADAHDAAAEPGEVKLCTSFADFRKYFGGFSIDIEKAADDPDHSKADRKSTHSDLAHGVFAFFDNGGTRCYVMAYPDLFNLQNPEGLLPFEAVDEIALVAAPGIHDKIVQENLVDHCTKMGDRFAILDSAVTVSGDLTKENIQGSTGNSDYAALYFPAIKVFDIAAKLFDPDSDGEIYVGSSGHMAGVYAHVDTTRGVHKAPANEVIRGALDIRYPISNAIQDGLNPNGINCIRNLNGNIRSWGARTLGGDMNEDFKYINVRRLFLFLRKSIDRGTQWVVFEPNDRALWAKIVRNVTAFLTEVWRDGALFGSTPQEAFFVKCDDETNPPDERELGRVTTEIGVAVTKPAEFVIFRISQWAGPKGA